MADSTYDAYKGVIARLKGFAGLTAIVGQKIFSDVPQQQEMPYVVVDIESSPFATFTDSDLQHTVTVHGYSDKTSKAEAIRISENVFNALDREETNISIDNGTLVLCQFSGVKTVFEEPDGKTIHSVIEFNLIID